MNPPQVPLLDLKAQFNTIRDEINHAIQRVVESQHFIKGPEVSALQQEVAEYAQTKHCIGVSSGTDALLLALMAFDLGPGDEVITTPYTFFATAGSISRTGARPVFVDIDPTTYNIDAQQIEQHITPATRAIMPVHLFGQTADMNAINTLAKKHCLAVIEDGAQAIGATYHHTPAGGLGDVGCFSFFPSKNLGAFGDGGAVVTNDDTLAQHLSQLANHGAKPKYYHQFVGGNFRLDALHAAVLRVKLPYLDQWTQQRNANAQFYTNALTQAGLEELIQPPTITQTRHVFNQYVIRVQNRDALKDHLTKNGVGTEVYYPRPMHLQECFASLDYQPGDFPHSESAALQTLALPIYPELKTEQLEYVIDTLKKFYLADRRQAA